jgi:hypothetical protein
MPEKGGADTEPTGYRPQGAGRGYQPLNGGRGEGGGRK